jgi:adenosine kinase
MSHAHENRVEGALGAGLAIIAPDGKEGMIQHARQCAGAGIPFVFDPGQGLPMFSREELAEFVRLADYVAVNDYEGKLLEEKTGRKLEELAGEVKALIVTRGARGSRIFAGGRVQDIPIAPAESVTDPTGCGDAYRAGLLYGIAKGWDWANTGRLGAVLGAIKIASRGAQNHRADRALVEARFQQAFGYSPWN